MAQTLAGILRATSLENVIRFYVPKVKTHTKDFISEVSEITGGCTVTNGEGHWGDCHEKVKVVEAYHNLNFEEKLTLFEAFGAFGQKAKQKALAYCENNGAMMQFDPFSVRLPSQMEVNA